MLEVLIDAENQLGECPLWCDRTQRVFWTDIPGARLYAHHPASGRTRHWNMPEPLASFAFTEADGTLLLGLASQLALFDLESGELRPVCPVEEGLDTRLNDGRCDRQGRFVFGTMHRTEPRERIGAFYRLGPGLVLEKLPLPNCAIANSICFSPDGETMFYCDSPQRVIRCCDYPADGGAPSGDRVFVALDGPAGEPDGSCMDADGYLWNAQWGAGRVVRYAPDGTVERMVETPALQPSCVMLGGPALSVLYVTSARLGLAEPAVYDGSLMHLSLGDVCGIPEARFRY